jgi:hypothetical protein
LPQDAIHIAEKIRQQLVPAALVNDLAVQLKKYVNSRVAGHTLTYQPLISLNFWKARPGVCDFHAVTKLARIDANWNDENLSPSLRNYAAGNGYRDSHASCHALANVSHSRNPSAEVRRVHRVVTKGSRPGQTSPV